MTTAGSAWALRWIGHATTVVDVDGIRVLTDPLLRRRVGPLTRHAPPIERQWWTGPDIVLLSHLHHDHVDVESLRRLPSSARVLAPRGAAPVLRRTGLRDVVEVSPGDRVDVRGLSVDVVHARHDDRRWRGPWGAVAAPVGYLVRGSTRVYFAGDTDAFPEMSALRGHVDVALLPVGGWGVTLGSGHLDPLRAAQALQAIRPRIAVPVHWGTLRPVGLRRVRPELFEQPGRLFAQHAAELAADVTVAVPAPGELLEPTRVQDYVPVPARRLPTGPASLHRSRRTVR